MKSTKLPLPHTRACAQYTCMIHTQMPMPTRAGYIHKECTSTHADRNPNHKTKRCYFLESIKNIWENPSIEKM